MDDAISNQGLYQNNFFASTLNFFYPLLYLGYTKKRQTQMQDNLKSPVKKRASTPKYVSPNQLILPGLPGFETPI